MENPITQQEIIFRDGIPPKNKILMALLFLKFPLFVPFIKNYVKKHLPHCDGIDFSPGFMFYYGNIYSKNISFNGTFILGYASVYVGENTILAWNNIIITTTHDIYNFNNVVAKPVVIGKNVYITSRCVITGGVTISDNSVISAGRVVVKDIPANCLIGGNLARAIKYIDRKLPD